MSAVDDGMAIKVIMALKSVHKRFCDQRIMFLYNPVSKGENGLHRLLAVDYDVLIRCGKGCGWLMEKEGGKVSFYVRGFKKTCQEGGD